MLALDPDLIVTTEFSTPTTVSLLERLGRRVVKIPFAHRLDGVREAVRQIAEAVGAIDAGNAIIANFDRRLAALATAPRDGPAPTAVIYQVNSLVSGIGTLEDEALRIAGFRNMAPELNLDPGGRVALEAIVAHPPDLLVLSGPSGEYRTVVADNLYRTRRSRPLCATARRLSCRGGTGFAARPTSPTRSRHWSPPAAASGREAAGMSQAVRFPGSSLRSPRSRRCSRSRRC